MTSNKEPVKSHNNPFIGKIYCTSGTRFQSKESPVCVFWRCGRNLRSYGGHCSMKGIPEETLEPLCCGVLEIEQFDPVLFKNCVERINVTGASELTYPLKDGSEIDKSWNDRSRAESWTAEMRAKISRQNREGEAWQAKKSREICSLHQIEIKQTTRN